MNSGLFASKPGPVGWRRKLESCERVCSYAEAWQGMRLRAWRQRLFVIGPIVRFERVDCHFGGSRSLVLCPDCDRRCVFLYRPPGESDYTCRICLDLIYKSETESAPAGMVRRMRKLVERLGGQHPLGPWTRPARMRRHTYNRIEKALRRLNSQYAGYLMKSIRGA